MANTYTQIHIQRVMAVKHRMALIDESWKERLHQYITGIVQNHNRKVLSIKPAWPLHLFPGFRPVQSLADLMRIVKSESSEWINKQRFTAVPFKWQEGYGAFSYSRSQIPAVCNYIENQKEHHKKKPFLEESTPMLEKLEIEFNEQYIFKLAE